MRSRTIKQLRQLTFLIAIVALFVVMLHAAISLPPAFGQADTAESELLAKQLEFILKMNSAFLGFLGVSGTLAAYFFGKSFKELQDFAKANIQEVSVASQEKMKAIQDTSKVEIESAVETVKKNAEREIAYLVDNELREVVRNEVRAAQRVLQRERVIASTSVDYYLPNGDPMHPPREVELIRAREFEDVQFFTTLDALRPQQSDVVVLDLMHFSVSEGELFTEASKPDRDRIAKPIVDSLTALFPKTSVVIVYVNGFPRLDGLDSDDRYILAANSPITVVGNSADGAYVAKGAQNVAEES